MMARRQAGSPRTVMASVEEVRGHAVEKKDDGGLAGAPDRWQQRPDQTRDRGEVGAVAGGHGDPARVGFAGADGAPVAEGFQQLERALGEGAGVDLAVERVGDGAQGSGDPGGSAGERWAGSGVRC